MWVIDVWISTRVTRRGAPSAVTSLEIFQRGIRRRPASSPSEGIYERRARKRISACSSEDRMSTPITCVRLPSGVPDNSVYAA